MEQVNYNYREKCYLVVHVPKVVPVVAGILVTILIKDPMKEGKKKNWMKLKSAKQKFSNHTQAALFSHTHNNIN